MSVVTTISSKKSTSSNMPLKALLLSSVCVLSLGFYEDAQARRRLLPDMPSVEIHYEALRGLQAEASQPKDSGQWQQGAPAIEEPIKAPLPAVPAIQIPVAPQPVVSKPIEVLPTPAPAPLPVFVPETPPEPAPVFAPPAPVVQTPAPAAPVMTLPVPQMDPNPEARLPDVAAPAPEPVVVAPALEELTPLHMTQPTPPAIVATPAFQVPSVPQDAPMVNIDVPKATEAPQSLPLPTSQVEVVLPDASSVRRPVNAPAIVQELTGKEPLSIQNSPFGQADAKNPPVTAITEVKSPTASVEPLVDTARKPVNVSPFAAPSLPATLAVPTEKKTAKKSQVQDKKSTATQKRDADIPVKPLKDVAAELEKKQAKENALRLKKEAEAQAKLEKKKAADEKRENERVAKEKLAQEKAKKETEAKEKKERLEAEKKQKEEKSKKELLVLEKTQADAAKKAASVKAPENEDDLPALPDLKPLPIEDKNAPMLPVPPALDDEDAPAATPPALPKPPVADDEDVPLPTLPPVKPTDKPVAPALDDEDAPLPVPLALPKPPVVDDEDVPLPTLPPVKPADKPVAPVLDDEDAPLPVPLALPKPPVTDDEDTAPIAPIAAPKQEDNGWFSGIKKAAKKIIRKEDSKALTSSAKAIVDDEDAPTATPPALPTPPIVDDEDAPPPAPLTTTPLPVVIDDEDASTLPPLPKGNNVSVVPPASPTAADDEDAELPALPSPDLLKSGKAPANAGLDIAKRHSGEGLPALPSQKESRKVITLSPADDDEDAALAKPAQLSANAPFGKPSMSAVKSSKPVAAPVGEVSVSEDLPPLPPLPSAPDAKDVRATATPQIKAAPPAAGTLKSVDFADGEVKLPAGQDDVLGGLAKTASKQQLVVVAYADPKSDNTNARHEALARALAVRAGLIDNGMESKNIRTEVKSDAVPAGSDNRVDIVQVPDED